jgi:hypothetical protein
MARYIELPNAPESRPSRLRLGVGDVLRCPGTGVRTGDECVEVLGVLAESVVGTDGTILTHSGTPNVVLIRARSPGLARIEIVTGRPADPTGGRAPLHIQVVA